MDLRPLGNTGILVSPLALGTVRIGRTEGLKYPRGYTLPDDDEVRLLLGRAVELGVNVLDTAPAYGSAEGRLGALRPGRRADWVIVTKAGEEFEDGRSRFDFSRARIEASVARSLRDLRTDYLDAVLLHSDGVMERSLDSCDGLAALLDLRTRGCVRAVGVSTKTVEGARRAAGLCDVVMLTLNPRDRADAPVIAEATRRGVGVLIKKGLLSGHVACVREHLLPGEPGSECGDAVEASLRFIFSHSGVGSVAVGTADAEHLKHNVAAAERALKA